MEETHFFITELMNCLSWIALTIALIVATYYIVKSHREVKMAIVRKLNAETERIKNDNNTREFKREYKKI